MYISAATMTSLPVNDTTFVSQESSTNLWQTTNVTEFSVSDDHGNNTMTGSDVIISEVYQTSTYKDITPTLAPNDFRYDTDDSITRWSTTTGDVIRQSTSLLFPKRIDDSLRLMTSSESGGDVIISSSYYVVGACLIVLLGAMTICLVGRRILHLTIGNGLSLPYHVTSDGAPYISVDEEPPCCRSWCVYLSNCCYCFCRLVLRHQLKRSPASPNGNKYDYIYRPLSGTSSGGGNRIEDEYETTFVGVSIPLLHEVSDL